MLSWNCGCGGTRQPYSLQQYNPETNETEWKDYPCRCPPIEDDDGDDNDKDKGES